MLRYFTESLFRLESYLKLLLVTTILLGWPFLFSACNKDKDPAPPTVIEFESTSQDLIEGQEAIIKLKLSATTPQITVVVNLAGTAVYTNDFNTNPSGNSGFLIAEVFNGASATQFTVSTVNNEIFEGDKTITLTLGAPPDGYEIGTNKTITITIKDDESPAIANFEKASATIDENGAAGITVMIPFSSATEGAGTLTVGLASINATYGTNFTTLPAAVGNSISFAVPNQSTGTSITIIPKDDSFFHSDFVIVFELVTSTGSVRIGTLNKFTLTIKEDEAPSLANFNISSATIAENAATSISVKIPLSIPASDVGTVTASFASTNATYGTHFTTAPAAPGGNVVVNVAKDATQVEFTITPIDDLADNVNRKIIFTLSSSSGVVRLGQNIAYELTITDNDPTLRKVFISFGSSTAPKVTGTEVWNHAYAYPKKKDTVFTDFVRSDGVSIPISIRINSVLTPQPHGATTVNNNGVFPDNALKEYWFVPLEADTRGFSLIQLDDSKVYTFRIHGGIKSSISPVNEMIVSVNGIQKSIANVADNVSQVLTWTDLVSQNQVITINLTDGIGFCPINAMEISWYEE